VFLCLRAAGVEVGLALGGGSSTPSSDVQVVADLTAPTTSADDLFDRRAGTRASVAFGGFALDEGSTKAGGGKGSSGGNDGGSGGGGNNGGGGTDPTPPPHPGLLQPVKDALKPVTDATGTGPVVDDVKGTVEGTLDAVTGSLAPLPDPGLKIPSLP
jgi:hypothetical protein